MNSKNFLIIFLCCIIFYSFPSITQSATLEPESIPIKLSLTACPIAIEKYPDKSKQIEFIRGYRDGYRFALIVLNPKHYSSSLDAEKHPMPKVFD
jgi:hypothetical protein